MCTGGQGVRGKGRGGPLERQWRSIRTHSAGRRRCRVDMQEIFRAAALQVFAAAGCGGVERERESRVEAEGEEEERERQEMETRLSSEHRD